MIVLNEKISHITDKVRMNQLLDRYKIMHPKTYYYPFSNIPDTRERCVVKRRFGQRGTGIKFTRFNKIYSIYGIDNKIYIQHFIPFEREYRVGITFRRILGVREKILKSCRG